jgi:hypothetical protein
MAAVAPSPSLETFAPDSEALSMFPMVQEGADLHAVNLVVVAATDDIATSAHHHRPWVSSLPMASHKSFLFQGAPAGPIAGLVWRGLAGPIPIKRME